MTTHEVSVSDGATLHVKLFGGTSTSKPLLIALHGAPGLSTHTETEATFAFLESTFRIIVYDARGSGASSKQLPYTHERWVQDVDELRAWAGAEKFVITGGSYGGTVSLDYALAFPNRLSGLILRDTWTWGTRMMMRALKTTISSDLAKVDAERQFRLWTGLLRDDEDFVAAVGEIGPLYAPPGAATEEAVPEWEVEGLVMHAATQNAAFSENMPRYDVRSRLKDIKVPTLVIVGRHDVITPVSDSVEISEGIPGSQLAIFEHSGHHPGNDEPVAFRTRVNEFLSAINRE